MEGVEGLGKLDDPTGDDEAKFGWDTYAVVVTGPGALKGSPSTGHWTAQNWLKLATTTTGDDILLPFR
jgi:hypothetical protein